MTPPPGGEIELAERLLGLLDRGAFTSTYKYAVVLALLDLCLEGTAADGSPPTMVTTRQLAGKVVALYWPQALPFGDASAVQVLRQNTSGQAGVVSKIEVFRRNAESRSWAAARRRAPNAAEDLLDAVEWILIQMPLPRLQRVGSRVHPVLYEIAWNDDVRRAGVSAYQRALRQGTADAGGFDNRIQLLENVGIGLVRLGGVLRPLLHREWARMVARINRLPRDELERFLFEPEREAVRHLAPALGDLQAGRCFYCAAPVGSRPHVDHVIPFARYPDHSLANLVLTDPACNGNKRDHLPVVDHVWRLRQRNEARADDLQALADATHPEGFRPARAWNVTRAIYGRLPEGVELWQARDSFDPFDRQAWLALEAA